ncbi:hypothetical protein GRF29_8g2246898 [Pseudopithomyces chartarum]|uniref:FAD-binding FR-type domain-containing protein n=1 Tax=Pseudopithomyces chartarum TaxID=1892770 RepID=A0AAN6RK30_9PLEO|nr:hypothetical protein GRF29_8g2246898 [Pseudopithomyces chartarum]
MAMEIKYDKSWNLGPGQYIYVTLPRLSFHTLGLVQSHPYVITWNDGQHITILVERCKGFSNAIFALSDAITHSAIIDGPYGRVQSLGQYDKVLLLASGIGVAAHLLHIRQLLEAHEDKSVRVRRVALTWFLESPEQEKWAGRFLRRLQEIDNHNTDGRQIFVLKIYTTGVNEFQSKDSRYLRTSKILNLSAEIDGEAGVEGGNTAVSVCGNPHFESAVRKGVQSSKRDIHLFVTGFRPEESEAGKIARGSNRMHTRFKRRTYSHPTMARSKRRATDPKIRKEEKSVMRQCSSQLGNTDHNIGEEKTYSGTAKPIRVQVDSNARDQPSSSLPSASSPIAPPSPWLAHRGPHRNKLSAASDDHDQIISGNSAMNTSDREETPSPPGMTTGLRDQQSQKQLVPADLTEVSTLRNGSSSSSEQRPLQPNDSASVPTPRIFHPPALIPKSTVPAVAMMGHHSVSNYLPTSYRPTAAPAYANSGMTSVSMALTTPEQQLYLAKRVIFYNQARLSATEKNMVLINQDIKSSSEGYWKDTSFMDNMGSNVPESYYKPQLQMRAAYLWARNCDMVSYPDLVKLLGLPPGFLKCWIWRYADRSPNFDDSDKNGPDATLSMKLSTLRLQRMNRLKLVTRSPEHHWPSEEECSSLYDLLKLFDWNCYKMCRENIDMTPMLDAVDEQIESNYYKTWAKSIN